MGVAQLKDKVANLHPDRRGHPAARAAAWMVVVGTGIGASVGLLFATLLTASGFTSIDLPPMAGREASATPTPSATATAPPATEAEPDEPQPTLEGPGTAPPGQRFELKGQLPSASAGTTLQVQVKDVDRDWMDFPVTVTVGEGGSFTTQLWTSRTGDREFRLMDKASNESTPVVKVTIG